MASGELPDASLEFCSQPLKVEEEKKKKETELSREPSVKSSAGKTARGVVKVEKRKKRPRKRAAVDQGKE